MLPRIYDEAADEHLEQHDQMLFFSGPRRVGKTTTSLNIRKKREIYYFNWDDDEDRLILTKGSRAILDSVEIEKGRKRKPVLVFDELHKSRRWKGFLKGFYDKYHYQADIVVTGSARLDVYQKGGDSLMGRYFYYRVHPFSVGELVDPTIPANPVRPPRPLDDAAWEALERFGGFPEPFLKAADTFSRRWGRLRRTQLFRDDLRELSRVEEIAQMEHLAESLRAQVGSNTSFTSLSKRIRIAIDTVRRWSEILQSLYYVFAVRPWSGNVPRSLTKEPKYYLHDWSSAEDPGARAENLIASHLLKAVHFWTDHGFGDYGLYYLRDRSKREVDFAVVKDGKPWMLVEVKRQGSKGISPSLHYFAKITGAPHVFQVAFDAPYADYDCFTFKEPRIVPARTLLSQLI